MKAEFVVGALAATVLPAVVGLVVLIALIASAELIQEISESVATRRAGGCSPLLFIARNIPAPAAQDAAGTELLGASANSRW